MYQYTQCRAIGAYCSFFPVLLHVGPDGEGREYEERQQRSAASAMRGSGRGSPRTAQQQRTMTASPVSDRRA